MNNSWLELAYAQKGSYDQAVETHLKTLSVLQSDSKEIVALDAAYRTDGWRGFCRKKLELMKEQPDKSLNIPYNLARASARAGAMDQALDWLEKAYAEHSDHLVLLKVDPIFDELRSTPRFVNLLRRIGFQQ